MVDIELRAGPAPDRVRVLPGTTLRRAFPAEAAFEGLCEGRGMCGRCRCRVDERDGLLAPTTERERRTLDLLGDSVTEHRLACQARVLGGRLIVHTETGAPRLRPEDLEPYVGLRADTDLYHPETGERLVPAGRIMLRLQLMKLIGTREPPRVRSEARGRG